MKKDLIVLSLLLAIVGSLIISIHSSTGYFSYRSEIAGDKAGYYIYLPAIFIYDLKGDELPPGIIDKLYNGFSVDSISGLIRTKYSIGVAMMQTPAFLCVHGYQWLTGGVTDGFSGPYHNVANFSAWLYTSLGLWFLFRFLSGSYGRRISLLTVLIVFFGTHLFYYSLRETGMSHLYSFFLFSALLWLLGESSTSGFTRSRFILLGLILGLMIVVRPLNLVFFLGALLYFQLSDQGFYKKFWHARILWAIAAALLVALPQLWYWHSISGKWIYYSYGNEGFTNLLNPQFRSLLFAPLNGLLPYTPLYLVLILSSLVWVRTKPALTIFFIAFFIALSYLLASWHRPQFGCGFGSRNYVEYLALFIIPLAEVLHRRKGIGKALTIVAISICTLANLKLTLAFETCFWGTSMWDWPEYQNMLLRGVYWQRDYPEPVQPGREYQKIAEFVNPAAAWMTPYARAVISARVSEPPAGNESFLVMELRSNDSIYSWWGINIHEKLEERPFSNKIYEHLNLPGNYPADAEFRLLLWNKGQDSLRIDYTQILLR